ncbi:PAAR domain-containing protein [Franconibacter helveticus]|uniref:PAAR domain-containing protein n=1 Tax=Franconibacter helveticus TaxID=357240 RepID=UPI00066ACD77|nr:PAAR domain-containing protein [Franconibacter helveticus]
MRGVIRLNDPLTSGGKVITASGPEFNGVPVMLKGDMVTCPAHKGTFAVNDCSPDWTVNGRGVVLDKCRAECGCAALTTLPVAGEEK